MIGAVAAGASIAWMDTRPHWDDAGITAVTVFLASAVCGVIRPTRAWLWALAIGLWIPMANVALHHTYESSIALAFAFAGAYAGAGLRRLTTRAAGA